jgi:hypothetical protein
MKSAMSEFRPSSEAPQPDVAAPCNVIRDRMLIGLMLFTLIRASEALGGEQASITQSQLDADAADFRRASPTAPAPTPAPLMAAPGNFSAPAVNDYPVFSATDFRPRKHTVFDSDPTINAFAEAPMLRNTTVWQRLKEYRSNDGVRLLTLWESRGSTVSLQAGRRGDPSLQWTSRLNHGGSTQGLLDRLFSVSLARAGNGFRNVAARPASAAAGPVAGKPGDLAGVGK